MARIVVLAMVALSGAACREPVKYPWMIVPGVRLGPFPAQASEADLRSRFGVEVQAHSVPLGEGETVWGTVVFPDDPLRRIEIVWRDTTARREMKTVRVEGDSSLWKLESRIGLGTTLFELERINGRPFKLAGFGWDQQGVVLSWNEGVLQSSMKGVNLYLTPDPRHLNEASYRRIAGDREFSSDDGDVRALEPRVGRMVVAFDQAGLR